MRRQCDREASPGLSVQELALAGTQTTNVAMSSACGLETRAVERREKVLRPLSLNRCWLGRFGISA